LIATHEFSRLFDLAELHSDDVAFEIAAAPDERSAVARRLDLLQLDELIAKGTVAMASGGVVRVRGALQARLRQRCVVTLEPVAAELDAEFDRLFLRSGSLGAEVVVDPEEEEPEPLLGDLLDLGELVTEELALAIDPYPRRPDAESYLARYGTSADAGGGAGPLAEALRRLSRND